MHAFQHITGVTFNYNSDMSGDVIVMKDGKIIAEISGVAILAFVANIVRNEKISRIESTIDAGEK